MINDELKPCPFCGGSEYLQVRRRGAMHSSMPDIPMAVLCNNESCEDVWGPTMYGELDAIAAWNNRHTDTRLEDDFCNSLLKDAAQKLREACDAHAVLSQYDKVNEMRNLADEIDLALSVTPYTPPKQEDK